MLLMFEKGICDGVSMISKRNAKANNKYMKGLNLEEKPKFIQYLDANNLLRLGYVTAIACWKLQVDERK